MDTEQPVVTGQKIEEDVAAAIPFVQKQLSHCDAEHKAFCAQSIGDSPTSPRVPPPRVYNIATKCLEEGVQLDKSTLYAALSYLWGKGVVTDPIKTLKDNIASRRVPGGLDLENHPACPQVYRSAIEIARRLNMTHIWIDSVCMIQDDDDDRDRHFKQYAEGVGQIYQNARITLCAVGPDASFDMLAPRNVPTPDERVEIPFGGHPIVVVPRVQHLYDHLQAGGGEGKAQHWDSRGWTYQEWLLSPRLAYFTKSQVFYECSTVYEECGSLTLSLGGHNARSSLRTSVKGEELIALWDTIVADYSKRQLGYWSDRLNAIRSVGMQLVMRINRLTGGKIGLASGLLTERLEHGLLWQASDCIGLTRITREQWEKGKEVPPPSWSWASWAGKVTWEMHLRTAVSKLNVLSADDASIVLGHVSLLDVRPGKSLAIVQGFNLHEYALEVGSKTCSQGYKMPHWARMFALLHPANGSIIGRATLDTSDSAEIEKIKDKMQCLVASANPVKQNPHTFEDTESLNVLLVTNAGEGKYIRVGVGEIFIRTGEREVQLPVSEVVDKLVLI